MINISKHGLHDKTGNIGQHCPLLNNSCHYTSDLKSYPCCVGDVKLVFQTGQGLFIVAQLAVQSAQFPVRVGLAPSVATKLMCYHQPLLKAHQRLLEVTHRPGQRAEPEVVMCGGLLVVGLGEQVWLE